MRYIIREDNGAGARLPDAIARTHCEAAQHVARRYGRRHFAMRCTGDPYHEGIWRVYRRVGENEVAHTYIEFHVSD